MTAASRLCGHEAVGQAWPSAEQLLRDYCMPYSDWAASGTAIPMRVDSVCRYIHKIHKAFEGTISCLLLSTSYGHRGSKDVMCQKLYGERRSEIALLCEKLYEERGSEIVLCLSHTHHHGLTSMRLSAVDEDFPSYTSRTPAIN